MATWFVTGSSRGLGLEMVQQLAERGEDVIATARRLDSIPDHLRADDHVLAVEADVTSPKAVQEAVTEGLECFGGIDVVVNNAGYGITGAVEETTDAEVRAVFDTNFFGVLNVVRAVLPHMRSRRAGRILTIGSVAGLRGLAGVGVYSATKHALEGLTEAMAQELAPLGISVGVAELGAVRTGFLNPDAMQITGGRIADYGEGPTRFATDFATTGHGRQLNDVGAVASLLIDAATAPSLPVHLPVGPDVLTAVEARRRVFDGVLETWGARAAATAHADGGAGSPAR
ncbi:SDR family oxidoreductase [Pseudonocardia halophobica]|uniref:SDR family oxidoreductase n=1 Tax=Pseudonocardia halophobica TaxID=29401 RepID=UPI003D928285